MNRNMRKMYTEEEITELIRKNVLSGDIEIGGDLEVTGGVFAETLKQSAPNYLYEFEVNVEDTTNFEKSGTQYCRVEEVNGEIHIIILAKFHNTDTENAHSTRLGQLDITLPEELADKIYGYNGKISLGNGGIIRIAPIGIRLPTGVVINGVEINNPATPNVLRIYHPTTSSCAANGDITYSLEVNLSVV